MAKDKRVYSLLGVVLALVCLAPPIISMAQNAKNRIVKKVSYPNEPVRITAFSFKGGSIKIGQSFPGDDDWLSGLTVELENISNKAVRYIEISLRISNIKGREELINIPLKYGLMPTSDNTEMDYDHLLPNSKAKLVLTEDLYEAYKALIEQTDKMANICKVELVIDYVFFEDNTGWHTGITLHPSKSRKDFWVPEGSPDSFINTSSSKGWFRTVALQNYPCAVFEGSGARYECCDDPRGYGKCYIIGDAFHDSSGRTKALRQTVLCSCNPKVSCTYYRSGGSCKIEPILD